MTRQRAVEGHDRALLERVRKPSNIFGGYTNSGNELYSIRQYILRFETGVTPSSGLSLQSSVCHRITVELCRDGQPKATGKAPEALPLRIGYGPSSAAVRYYVALQISDFYNGLVRFDHL